MFTAIWKQILDTKYGRRKNRSPRFEKKEKKRKERIIPGALDRCLVHSRDQRSNLWQLQCQYCLKKKYFQLHIQT